MQIQLKPGKTTTEFWGTVIGAAILFVLTLLDQVEGEYAAIGGTILVALYQRQRAKLKEIQARAEAELVKPKIIDLQGKLPRDAAQ
jgi:hypothetical protein